MNDPVITAGLDFFADELVETVETIPIKLSELSKHVALHLSEVERKCKCKITNVLIDVQIHA